MSAITETTMPATTCATWCEGGHTDTLCLSPGQTVTLSRENDAQLIAYLKHDHEDGLRIALFRDPSPGVELTTGEAERLRDALTALLER